MGFGKKKKAEPAPVKPQIVVSPGSGSGLTDGQVTPAATERVEATQSQTSLLTQNDEDENALKKGIG